MSESFPVQNATPSAAALGELMHQRYALEAFPACKFWRKGMADTYRIDTGSQLFFLKVSMAGRRSRKDVEEEVRLLLHLAHGGIGVSLPIETLEGEHVLALPAPEGERYAVLFEAAVGAEGTTALHRRELGRTVARMHLCADSLEPSYDRDHFELAYVLDDSLVAIEALMRHRPDDYQVINKIAQHAKDVVTSTLPRKKPEHGVCHGDLFGGDVRYAPDGTPVIFDFDSSGNGWRALDIAVFQGSADWMDTTREADLRREQEVGEFLDGYVSVRGLSSGELEVLKLDQAVHHIFLMGLVLRFWTLHDGWHWANDGFIDWHMKWFRHWIEHHDI
jgi:Ser/Thr protein kinase RdoA (MazF antagonist)